MKQQNQFKTQVKSCQQLQQTQVLERSGMSYSEESI